MALWSQISGAGLAAAPDSPPPERLRLDRLRVEPAPQPGTNLVVNFSFEQAQEQGGPAGWVWERRNTDATAVLDNAVAHSGRQSLRITNGTPFGAHVYGLLRSARPIRLEPGVRYTLSCFVKSEGPGIAWIGGGEGWRLRLHFRPGSATWQRFSTSFTPSEAERDFVMLVSTESPTRGFWLDDIKLEEGATPTACLPAEPLENPLISPPLAQEFSDGPWLCRFETYSEKAVEGLKGKVTLKQKGLEQSLEGLLNLPAGVSQILVDGMAARASDAPCTLSLALEEKSGKPLALTDVTVRFFSAENGRERVATLREQTRTLKELVQQAQARKLDPAYPMVSATILENFAGYVLDDLDHKEVKRAFDQLAALEPMGQRTEQQLRRALDGREKLPEVPRYVTSPIAISGPSFLAHTAVPITGSAPVTRPVFFTGYGAFGQVRADIEKFPSYGINIIQIEFGPNSVFPREGVTSDAVVNDTLRLLDRAAKANVAVNLLISPHYVPGWLLEKYPHLRKKREGFLPSCVHAPEGQELLRRFIAFIIPKLKDHPALHSICLSNEPINVEEPCEFARRDWQAWLRKRHGDVATLNRRWHAGYGSFDEVPLPNPFEPTSAGQPAALGCEFVLFNQEFFASWHRMMAEAIHEAAPGLPVHAKAMTWNFFNDGDQRFGVNAELFGEFSQIHGNDSVNFSMHGRGEWAQDWQLNAMGHDLQRSMKNLPVFNSENHIIVDREKEAVPPEHVRAALWQAAVHGQSATAIWVWERTFNPNSDIAGSIMHRPACAEAVGHAGLDLMRCAEEVTALQRLEPQVVLLHSVTAIVLDGGDYTDCLGKLHQALSFTGLKIGFVTERQLAAGKLPSAPVLIVPNARHLPEGAFLALQKYTGKLVLAGGDDVLRFDEYGARRDGPASLRAAGRLSYQRGKTGGKELWERLREQSRNWGVETSISLSTPDGKPVWGVEWLSAEFNGHHLLNCINYGQEPVKVAIRRQGRLTRTRSLWDGMEVPSPFQLRPLEPLLVTLE